MYVKLEPKPKVLEVCKVKKSEFHVTDLFESHDGSYREAKRVKLSTARDAPFYF
jgi:hypothetical protein